MAEILSKTERKIIYEFNLNTRKPLTALAKKLHINRNTLEYQINKLLDKGILKGFFTMINGHNLGFTYYKYFVKARRAKIAVNELAKEPEIVWIGKTDGYWDFLITLKARNQEELNKILSKINSLIEIKEKALLIVDRATMLNERWLTDTNELIETVHLFSGEYKLDKIDKQIIEILSDNTRESLVNISKKIKLTPEATSKRIKNLEKAQVLLGYKARINYSLLGYDYYHILIGIKNPKLRNKIVEFLKQFRNCVTILDLVGRNDIQGEFIAQTYKEIRGVIDKLKENFPDEIETVERLFIIEESRITTF